MYGTAYNACVGAAVLFDIDGTLVLTGGAGIRGIARAFADLFGVKAPVDGISMGGRTDAWVLAELASASGVTADPSAVAGFPTPIYSTC